MDTPSEAASVNTLALLADIAWPIDFRALCYSIISHFQGKFHGMPPLSYANADSATSYWPPRQRIISVFVHLKTVYAREMSSLLPRKFQVDSLTEARTISRRTPAIRRRAR